VSGKRVFSRGGGNEKWWKRKEVEEERKEGGWMGEWSRRKEAGL
jgi:hypothetical protein